MKLRNLNISTLILLALLFSSLAFFVSAQENSVATGSIFLDSDQDGLTDTEEKTYGTDAHNPDTDGDGYSDGAEVKAGYDPTKPAPGDKILNSESVAQKTPDIDIDTSTDGASMTGTNLTEELAKKISLIANQTDSDNTQVSLDEVSQIVNEAISSQDVTITLPEIDPKTIRIKKQNYPESQSDEKMQADFTNYLATVFYIFASNSPIPITSSSDIISVMTQIIQKVTLSVSSQNPAALDDLSKSGEAILKQLEEVEVPEDLVDLHIKALQYAIYAQNLKALLKTDPNDPISGITNYSKISTFMQSLFSFANDARAKMEHYNLDYSEIQDKMKNFGVELPDMDIINSTLDSISKDTDTN